MRSEEVNRVWGWKTVERHVQPAITVDQARVALAEHGFTERSGDSRHATLVREGTWWTTTQEKMPVELAIAETETGLMVHIRYQQFVLFDTGDLERFGDEIETLLTNNG